MTWLDTFERIDATKVGGTFIGVPWRVALHSTEGPTIDGALAAFRATGSWPQITADPNTRRKCQHYNLDTSARALMHPANTPETNRANVIQIEIVGNAVDMPDLSADDLAWLGAEVLAPIRVVCPFRLAAPAFVRYPDSYGAGAPQRFTWNQWAGFSGVCGHQHVPGNDHGDPGAIDAASILAAITPAPAPPPEDDDVTQAMYCKIEGQNQVWVAGRDVLRPWPLNMTDPGAFPHALEQALTAGIRVNDPPDSVYRVEQVKIGAETHPVAVIEHARAAEFGITG